MKRASGFCAAFSAAIALFAAQGAFATNYDFTGQVDNNWNTANNWYIENGGAKQTKVPNGKHNLNFRSTATNIKTSFKNNPTVSISSKYTSCSWKVHVRDFGTESTPVVFNASTDANGLKVGNTTASDKTGYYIAYETGDAWLRLQKGTYETASGGLWYIGNAGVQGHVIAESGVKVSASQSLNICNGELTSNGAKVSGNVVYLGGYGSGTNGRADTHAIVRVNGGTMSSGSNTEIGCFTGSTTGGYALLSVFGDGTYTSGNNLQMGAANGIQHDQAWLAITNGTMTVNGSVYINGGDGGIAIGDGGSLTVSGVGLYVADGGRGYANVGGDFKISIGEGGVLSAKTITRRSTATGAQNVNVAFEGGTLKATVDSSSFVTDHSQVTVTVAAAGGTIDANGKTVTIPANIGEDPSSTGGGMTFDGGGTVTLSGGVSYNGKTTLTNETALAVTQTAAKTKILENGLVVAIPEDGIIDGTVVLTLQSSDTISSDELATSSFSGTGAANYAFELSADGKSVIVRNNSAEVLTWNGGMSGDWSGTGLWLDENSAAKTWKSGDEAVFATDSDKATLSADTTAKTLTFQASATVDGTGKLTVPAIAVSNGVTATISAPTVGALEKTGAGTLTLGSSRTEQTVVAEGTLAMSGGATLDATKLTLGTDPAKPVTLDLGGATLNGTTYGYLKNGTDVTLKNGDLTASGVYFNLRPNNGNLLRTLTFEDANLTTGRLGLNTMTDLEADVVIKRSNLVLQNNESNWIMQASTNGTLRIGMEDSLMEFGGSVYALTCRDLPAGALSASPSLFWSLSNSTLRVKNGSNFYFGRDDNYNKNIECPTGVLAATNSLIELASALYIGHGTQGANTAGSYTADFDSCTITAKQISVYNDRPLNAVRFNNTRFALNNNSSYWIETREAFETMGEGGTAIKPVTIGADGLVLDSNGYNGSLVADPQGPGAITKIGEGTLTLTRAQTSSSALNVNVGTVAVADGISVARPVTVADGATLKVDGSATFSGGIALASGATFSIAAPNADAPAVTASAVSFAEGSILELPQVPAKGRYRLLELSGGTLAADALSGVTVSGIAVPYALSVEGGTIYLDIDHDYIYVENQITLVPTITTDTVAVGRGGFNINTLALPEGGHLTYDPVATPIYVYGTTAGALTVGSGAKLALSANYADMTLGRIVLLTYKDGNAVLPENLNDIFDASSIASGATWEITFEDAPETSVDVPRKQIVLTVGDYANDAKELRILPIGDSITQGVTRDNQGDYPQYRTTIAARLAASGYKPKMLGLWKKANYDASHVMVPEDWAWHCGISGDRIITSDNRGGVRDNLHVFLDIAGDVHAVTLLIGTNDLSGGRTPEEVFTAWTNLVFTISALRPNAKIIGGTILERNAEPVSTTAKVVALNTLLRSAYEGNLLPANLVLLDLYPEVPLAESGNFFSDALHLNWKGCAAVGEAFAGAIKTALPLAGLSGAPDPTVTDEPQSALGAAETIPADYRDGMTHIFTIDAASATNGFSSAPYTATNNVVSLNRAVSKAGYYMELVRKGTNRRRYVWVDFDATGKTLDEIDFPWDGANLDFVAEKLHVYSNDPSIHVVAADDDSIVGAVEGTHFNYSAPDDATDPRVPADILLNSDTNEPQFGWNDTLASTSGHGGFQVHRLFSQTGTDTHWNNAEVLFAWNAWGTAMANAPDAIGIGTFAKSTSLGTGLSTDYTFVHQTTDGAADTLTANGYSVRHLEIWAMVETPENPQHGKWIGGVGPNMSTPENWDDNTVPSAGDTLDFSGVTSATTINGDIDATFGLVTNGTGVVTFTGDKMRATSFTDTSKVAVGANATVTLDGDLMFSGKTSDFNVLETIGAGGRFVVTGRYGLNPDCTGRPSPTRLTGGGLFVVGGFCDNAETWMFTEVNNGTQDWLIGPLGISGTCSTKGVWVHGGTASKPVLQANTNDFAIGLKTCLRENGTLTLNTTGDGDGEGHVITLDAGIYDKGKLFIAGKGKVVCNATATGTVTDGSANRNPYSGAVQVKDTATLAIKPGETLTTGAISVASNATLALPEKGTVTLTGALSLANGSALSFKLDGDNETTLALASDKTLPASGTVAIEFAEGTVLKAGKAYTLVSGANLAADDEAKFSLPEGARGALSVSSGNLVYTAPSYFFIKIAEGSSSELAVPFEWIYDNTDAGERSSAAEIAAALEDSGANGIAVWKSYCLGLDPQDAASLVLCDSAAEQPADGKIRITAKNLNVPDSLAGATVDAYLDKSPDGKEPWTQVGEGRNVASGGVSFDASLADAGSLCFFRIRVAVR